MRDEEKRLAESREKQLPMNLPDLQPAPVVEKTTDDSASLQIPQVGAAINKTEKVREILSEHEAGVTPAGIWTEVKDHFSTRAYLYAILKRLRDNDEVSIRRGKYLLKPKPVAMNPAEQEASIFQ